MLLSQMSHIVVTLHVEKNSVHDYLPVTDTRIWQFIDSHNY